MINLNINKNVFVPLYYPYLWDYSHRYNVFWGGRASGKTKFIMQKLFLKGLREKRVILLMRKETNKLRDSVWKELMVVLDDFKMRQFFEINKSELRATCTINGTEFKCLGLDEPEKIKGFVDVSDVFMDEVTAFTVDDVELIDGTLRSKKYNLPLQMYFSFNPISKANFVYNYFGFNTGVTPADTFILHSTYLCNPYLDSSYKDRMDVLRERNYNRWKIEALGEFCTLDKLVYNNWRIEDFNYKNIKGELLVGLDFGFITDISALVASILQEDEKKLYIFKTWGDTGKTNEELAQIIKSLGFAKSIIIADSAEQKSIEEIRRCGIPRIKPSTKGADSIIHGIQKLQNYEIIIHPSCDGIITEFENYSWKKDKQTGEYINKPIDAFNHYCDSLRYSLQCIKTGKLKSINKEALSLDVPKLNKR